MRTALFLSTVSAIVLLASAGTAEACSCPSRGEPTGLTPQQLAEWKQADRIQHVEKAYEGYFAVFSGEVIEKDVERVRFRLERAWKGALPAEFFMLTGQKRIGHAISASSCDFGFGLGQKYLIFASGKSIETMRTSKCSLSTALVSAGPIIEILDGLVKEREKNPKRTPAPMPRYRDLPE